MAKKLADKRSKSKLTKKVNNASSIGSPHGKQLNKDISIESKANLVVSSNKSLRNVADKEAKKPPIKMTFMKTVIFGAHLDFFLTIVCIFFCSKHHLKRIN